MVMTLGRFSRATPLSSFQEDSEIERNCRIPYESTRATSALLDQLGASHGWSPKHATPREKRLRLLLGHVFFEEKHMVF